MSREMEPDTVRVPSQGLNLSVEIFGEGLTNVLFVHGLGANRGCWCEARKFFPSSRFRLIFPDFPGVGGSDRPGDFEYSMAAFGRCLRDVVTFLGVSTFHVVAHSMGGVAALEACGLPDFSPTSFLSAEGNLAPEDAFMSSKVARLSESVFLKSYSKWVNLVEATLEVGSNAQHARFVTSLRDAAPVAVYRSAVSCQTLTRSGSLLDRFVRLPCALAYVYGSRTVEQRALPGVTASDRVQCHAIEGQGHFMMEDAEAFYRTALEFIERASGER
jgi:pimeloyl-ACP methyl ester carboxylesterase